MWQLRERDAVFMESWHCSQGEDPWMSSRLDLSTGNWLAGLFVLAVGVLLPILGVAKSFFFRSSAPKRSL